MSYLQFPADENYRSSSFERIRTRTDHSLFSSDEQNKVDLGFNFRTPTTDYMSYELPLITIYAVCTMNSIYSCVTRMPNIQPPSYSTVEAVPSAHSLQRTFA